MKKLREFMDEKPALSFIIVAGCLLFVGFLIFLFTKDNAANPHSITGWQALQAEGFSFYIWGIVLSVVITLIGIKAFKYFTNTDSAGFGNFWIAFAVFMGVAWGKGCTNKADDGVSSTKGRPVPVAIDTTRIPAEDLLPK